MPSVVNTLGDRTHFFYSCAGTTIENPQTITLWRKKSKFAKILGHQKGSTFGSVYNVFTSAPSPYGEKNPNLPKSWGIKKGQIFPQYTLFYASEYLERRCRAHSGGLRPPPCQPAFGRLAGAARSDNSTVDFVLKT